MPRYEIERDVPGAGKLPPGEIQSISQRSYDGHIAPVEELVGEHAKQGGFPANLVSRVRTIIDPTPRAERGNR